MTIGDHLASSDALPWLDAAYAASWKVVDDELLGICRNRAAMLMRHEPTVAAMSDADLAELRTWPTSDRFGPRERAAIAFTEQYLMDVATLTDAQVGELRTHLGDQGLADFVNALLVVEQRMTLELSLAAVL